ncbi:ABC1 family-domain-containing protein [Dichotomocladium elegans]|nr:ABC1 family-domain-containing protein [Dichotomocladium elegans]
MSAIWRRWSPSARMLVGTSLTGAVVYGLDARSEAQVVQRNLRTFYNGIALAVDYKLNFQPSMDVDSASRIEALHERVANRMFDVFERNGGLYIKMGQVIGTQSAILPPAYQRRARRLFDAAPAEPFEVVERVFREDFDGLRPSDVFAEFELLPVASASIAQVHKARLQTGEVVAVKIQKPAILKQMNWDLRAYRILLQLYEKIFDLPLAWSADYIEKHLRMEADFEREARNGAEAWKHFQEEPSLKDRVYVPKIYPEFSSKRVLVCEWVDGIRLTDTEKLKSKKLDLRKAMNTTIEAFSSQIFRSGFVHDDVQVVIIDHGLYIRESEKFRLEYCSLWEALFMLDMDTVAKLCKGWGIEDSNMFASITLQKPFNPNRAVHLGQANVNMRDVYEMQMSLKERIRDFLKDQQLFPRELIFISRNMNIVRANNKSVGSPVNRINVMARWALYGHEKNRGDDMAGSTWRLCKFESTLFLMSLSFWLIRVRDKANELLFGTASQGFEAQFGIKIDESIFDG